MPTDIEITIAGHEAYFDPPYFLHSRSEGPVRWGFDWVNETDREPLEIVFVKIPYVDGRLAIDYEEEETSRFRVSPFVLEEHGDEIVRILKETTLGEPITAYLHRLAPSDHRWAYVVRKQGGDRRVLDCYRGSPDDPEPILLAGGERSGAPR